MKNDRVGKPREPLTNEVFFVLTVEVGLSDWEFACGPMDPLLAKGLRDHFAATGGQFRATSSRIERAEGSGR